MGHGRSLVTIENKEDQLNIYEKILEKSLSVRETEKLANKSKKSEKKLKIKLFKEPFNTSLKKLKNKYNSEVKITLNGKEKGSIIIPFNNIDEFKELNKKLNGNK
jgi:ParB family chromosome partitioning protein